MFIEITNTIRTVEVAKLSLRRGALRLRPQRERYALSAHNVPCRPDAESGLLCHTTPAQAKLVGDSARVLAGFCITLVVALVIAGAGLKQDMMDVSVDARSRPHAFFGSRQWQLP